MNIWKNPWLNLMNLPLSGNVEGISPVTTWFSPNIELNYAGDKKIESEVVSEVASFGKQLGVLSDALQEVIDGKSGKGIEKFRELVADIAEIKEKYKKDIADRIESDLDRLRQQDPEALARILKKYG
jgi:hypothetical protein